MKHCMDDGGVCQSLLRALRMASSPILPIVMIVLLASAVQRGSAVALRQWQATRAALDYLGAGSVHAPTDRLAAMCAALGLSGRVKVSSSSTPIALCYGLWRPCILLSEGTLAALGAAELQAVLRHERVHMRRRDPLQLLVARSIAAAQPYLPVLQELAAALPLVQELAADRVVMRDGARDALGRALLTLIGTGSMAMTPILAVGMVTCLDERIDQLTGAVVSLPHLSRSSVVRTGVVLCSGLLLLAFLVVTRPAGM